MRWSKNPPDKSGYYLEQRIWGNDIDTYRLLWVYLNPQGCKLTVEISRFGRGAGGKIPLETYRKEHEGLNYQWCKINPSKSK